MICSLWVSCYQVCASICSGSWARKSFFWIAGLRQQLFIAPTNCSLLRCDNTSRLRICWFFRQCRRCILGCSVKRCNCWSRWLSYWSRSLNCWILILNSLLRYVYAICCSNSCKPSCNWLNCCSKTCLTWSCCWLANSSCNCALLLFVF